MKYENIVKYYKIKLFKVKNNNENKLVNKILMIIN